MFSYFLKHCACVCHRQYISVADSPYVSLIIFVCNRQPVSVTNGVCFCHKQFVSVTDSVYPSQTNSLCPSQTVCFCDRQSVSITDSVFLSHTVCFFHKQSVFLTQPLMHISKSQTLEQIFIFLNLHMVTFSSYLTGLVKKM